MANWHTAFEKLWKGRTFTNFEEAIENELLDKLNHPRLRKKTEVKFFEAVRRVNESPLSDSEKVQLTAAYINSFEKIKQQS